MSIIRADVRAGEAIKMEHFRNFLAHNLPIGTNGFRKCHIVSSLIRFIRTIKYCCINDDCELINCEIC